MEEELVIVIAGIFWLVIIVAFLDRLSAIKKEIQRNNFLKYKELQKDGVVFTKEDLRFLNM